MLFRSPAAMHGFAEIAQLLLDKGAYLHCEDIYGETPISYAREYDHMNVMKILMNCSNERLNKWVFINLH